MNDNLRKTFNQLTQCISDFVDSQTERKALVKDKINLLSIAMYLCSIGAKQSFIDGNSGYTKKDITEILDKIEDEEIKLYFQNLSKTSDKNIIIVPCINNSFNSEDFYQFKWYLCEYLKHNVNRYIDEDIIKRASEKLRKKNGESFYVPNTNNIADILDIIGESKPIIYLNLDNLNIQIKLFLLAMGYKIRYLKAGEKAKKAFIITDNDKIYESIVNALPIIDFTGTTAFLLPHKFFIDKKYKSQCSNLIQNDIITMEYYFPNPEMSITLIGDFIF